MREWSASTLQAAMRWLISWVLLPGCCFLGAASWELPRRRARRAATNRRSSWLMPRTGPMAASLFLLCRHQIRRITHGTAMGRDHRDQVLIVNLFLTIGQVSELGVERLELIGGYVKAQFVETMHEGVASGVLAQDDAVADHAYRFRGHDLIAERIAEDTVLVNAGLMGKGVASDDGLVGLHIE